MSLSKEDRLKALADALTLMLERLGDKALDSGIFHMNAAPFNRVPKTTWRELEEYGFTERCDTIGHPQCQFTGCVFRWKWATDSGGKWATIPVGSGPAFRWEAGHFCRCDRNGGPVDRNGTFEEGWRR
jgi:hypothetical protein